MPKLLLADDSVTIQRVIELTFADENIQVIAVGDGQQAIARIDAEHPDVVLADIGMPERDGYEVAAHVKGNPQTAHIPVLLLTGAFEPIDEARARAVGCDGVLVKPFEPQMVINRVKDLLAGRRPASLWSTPGAPAAGAPAQGQARREQANRNATSEQPREPAASREAQKESLDDYFDRLDAAFSAEAPPPPAFDATPHASSDANADFGTWDIPFESKTPRAAEGRPPVAEPPAAARPAAAAPSSPPANELPTVAPELSPVAQAPALADAFAALLAAEQKVGSTPVSAPVSTRSTGALDETTLDDIVRRVIARLTDEAVRSTVLEVAERLVREEIDRIKQQARL
jgi:CheY-like chemotaxis protein